MSDAAKPIFLVDAECDPLLIRIEGRACFQNSACLRDFFATMTARGKRRFVIDFGHCASMDSTFLGVLAGVALDLRGQTPAGSLVLCQVGPRNLELLQNLGLHKLLCVDTTVAHSPDRCSALDCQPQHNELENARLALEAHRNLVAADDSNRTRFQDVLAFLQKRVEQGG